MSSSAKSFAPDTVLLVHQGSDLYGSDKGLLHTLDALKHTRFYPIVVLPQDQSTGPLLQELTSRGVEVIVIPLGILRSKFLHLRTLPRMLLDLTRAFWAIRRVLRQRAVKLVYVNTSNACAAAATARLAGVPVIWHIREIFDRNQLQRRLLHRTVRLCATTVLCVSKAVRHAILADEPLLATHSQVIYNAVPAREASTTGAGRALRQSLGIPLDAPLIGSVGRFNHWKGQDVFVEAAALILRCRPEVHFLAAGSFFDQESHFLSRIEQRVALLPAPGQFHLLGYRTDVAAIYDALDLFVLPSKKPEPFGRVTAEAMMHGCAVIATDHGGSPELFDDGISGWLVAPGDAPALADRCCSLLHDHAARARTGETAAARAHERFALSRYQREIAEVFRLHLKRS